MIIWGSGSEVVNVRPEGTHFCPVCERQRPYWLVLAYDYAHLNFLAGWVTSREYYVVCEICNRGEKMDRASVESTLDRVPIPFMKRHGFLLCLVLTGVFILFSVITT